MDGRVTLVCLKCCKIGRDFWWFCILVTEGVLRSLLYNHGAGIMVWSALVKFLCCPIILYDKKYIILYKIYLALLYSINLL